MNEPPNIATFILRTLGIFNSLLGMACSDLFVAFIGAAMIWGSLYLDAKQRRTRQPPPYFKEM